MQTNERRLTAHVLVCIVDRSVRACCVANAMRNKRNQPSVESSGIDEKCLYAFEALSTSEVVERNSTV